LKPASSSRPKSRTPPPGPVGEGGERLEEVGRGACVGGFCLHALELSVAAAQFGDEAED